ncbi:hypothetical protein SERLADRAFT_434370 [Serpula lacrymans var. lacrymans S7.9]|uniref:Uncharacterized protein n=1 Tax=Serpula lacrymans var. lacrymans (strain S7.9) TaxID=578457 RepID=F8NKP7_SERL9|nr:uncharacterized protein SERLADRAFT_434370 [Serpula lacrymans var. lacrymans S7.9]EGO28459.1 hypothetical protein SERLADRAFT_434370 [Serpula lacrymans var. lacrymans S7.9]
MMKSLSPAQKNRILNLLDVVKLLTLLPLPLVSMSLPSLDFAPRSVLSFKSLLEVVHLSFLLPMSTMPCISSPLARQKMLSRYQSSYQHHQPTSLPKHCLPALEKDWHEGCGQAEMPSSLCQAL